MWDMVVLLLPAVIAAAAAGLVYGKKRREKAIVLSSALVSFAVAYAAVLLAGYAGAALLSGAIAVFISLSAFFYLDDNALFYPLVIMGFAYLGLMVLLSGADVSATSFAAACGIGLMAGLEARIYGFRGRKPQKNGRRKLEIRRDVVQIALGIIVIAVFLAAGRIYGILAVAGLALLGYLFNSASMQAENAVGRFARSFERERAVRGEGALFMAAGSMLILGLVAPVNYALFGLSAIFFADSAATIIGVVAGRRKLPHNRRKSFAGTLSYFVVIEAIGIPLIGLYAIPIGIALAVVESLPIAFDDNASTSIAFVILSRLLFL